MLYKFGSNLDFETNGNSVIIVNSVTTTAPPPVTFCSVPDTHVATLGFALARRRPLRVVSLIPWPLYKAQTPSPFFLSLLCFSRRRRSSPSSPRRRHSASPSQPSLPQLCLSLAHRLSISPHRKRPRPPFTPRPGALPPCHFAVEPWAHVARPSRTVTGRVAVTLRLALPPRRSITPPIATGESSPAGNRVSPASSVLQNHDRGFAQQ